MKDKFLIRFQLFMSVLLHLFVQDIRYYQRLTSIWMHISIFYTP